MRLGILATFLDSGPRSGTQEGQSQPSIPLSHCSQPQSHCPVLRAPGNGSIPQNSCPPLMELSSAWDDPQLRDSHPGPSTIPPSIGPSLFLRANSLCCSYPRVKPAPIPAVNSPGNCCRFQAAPSAQDPPKIPIPALQERSWLHPSCRPDHTQTFHPLFSGIECGKKGANREGCSGEGQPQKVPGLSRPFSSKCHKIPPGCFLKIPKNSKDPEFGQGGGEVDGKAAGLWEKGWLCVVRGCWGG